MSKLFLFYILLHTISSTSQPTLTPTIEPTINTQTPTISPSLFLTSDELSILNTTYFVTGLVSWLASAFVILFIFIGNYDFFGFGWGIVSKKLSFHLILMISISDIFRSTKVFFKSPNSESSACGAQLFFNLYGSNLIFFWIFAISYSMEQLFNIEDQSKKNIKRKIKYLKIKFHAVIWLFSLILALIPVISKVYTNNHGSWCWFKDNKMGYYMELFCYYIWFILSMVLILFFYCKLFYRFSKKSSKDIPTIDRLLWYPMGFFLLWALVAFQSSWNLTKTEPPFNWMLASTIVGNLYGVGNLLLFGYILYENLNIIREINEAKKNTMKLRNGNSKLNKHSSKQLPGNIEVIETEKDPMLTNVNNSGNSSINDPKLKGIETAKIRVINDDPSTQNGNPITVEQSYSEHVRNIIDKHQSFTYYNEDLDFDESDDDDDDAITVTDNVGGNIITVDTPLDSVQEYQMSKINKKKTFDDDDVNAMISEIKPIKNNVRVVNMHDENTDNDDIEDTTSKGVKVLNDEDSTTINTITNKHNGE